MYYPRLKFFSPPNEIEVILGAVQLNPTAAERLTIVFGPELASYSFGKGHPLKPGRYLLTVSLLTALGWLDRPGVEFESPRPATLSELLNVHSYAYVQAVQQAQSIARGERDPVDLRPYGLGTEDDPLFDTVHDAAMLYTGATIQGMNALLEDRADHAYCPAGGQHHAQKANAAGFCVYNDCAAAIVAATRAGRRVAYVDFDAHHGDGVQAIFYDNPRVLTISIHESGRFLFPGTGDIMETGVGDGKGTCVNIPLPPRAGDEAMLLAFEQVVEPAVRFYAPDILVTQTGADSHHADPLSHLATTLPLFPRLAVLLHDLAHECCAGRWLIAGGGGYDPADVTPRAWSAFLGAVLKQEVHDVALPDSWIQTSKAVGGHPPTHLLEDPGPSFVPLGGEDLRPLLDKVRRIALAELFNRDR